MIDKFYLNIIVNAESEIFENGGLLSECYNNAFLEARQTRQISQDKFYHCLLKVIEVFEEDIQGEFHIHNILMDVVPEKIIGKPLIIGLDKYQPDKEYWRFDYPIEDYRIEQHKKAIEKAFKTFKVAKEIEQENPYPRIFNSPNAVNIFKSLLSDYKNEPNLTANFSFVYYAMKNDGFIICGGSEFIKFLSDKFEIEIDRVSSRQAGTNKRTKFYNRIKDNSKLR